MICFTIISKYWFKKFSFKNVYNIYKNDDRTSLKYFPVLSCINIGIEVLIKVSLNSFEPEFINGSTLWTIALEFEETKSIKSIVSFNKLKGG